MNKKDLNQMENTTSAQVYYQWLEKSISASKGCYEMTVIEGELSGMKILWEGEMPVCVYMTDEKTETQKKAAAIITSVMEQSEWIDRRLPSVLEFDFGKVFAEKVGGGQQMIICGAGHVSIALLRMARMVGFYVTVIDDRPAFCNKAREAGADEVICEPFSQALEAIDDRNEPYFVIVTRGHQYDVDCMHAILGKRHSYIGMMGSRVRVKNLKAGLLEEGYDQMLLDSVHMPIGLKIGACYSGGDCGVYYRRDDPVQKKLYRGLLLFFRYAEDAGASCRRYQKGIGNHYRQERLRTEGGRYENGCAGRRKNQRYHRRRLRRGGSNYESALLYAGRSKCP